MKQWWELGEIPTKNDIGEATSVTMAIHRKVCCFGFGLGKSPEDQAGR